MRLRQWGRLSLGLVVVPVLCVLLAVFVRGQRQAASVVAPVPEQEQEFIKWAEFNVPAAALEQAYRAALTANEQEWDITLSQILASLAASYWGNWGSYRRGDVEKLMARMEAGETLTQINEKYSDYPYFYAVYEAVTSGWVGDYAIELPAEDDSGTLHWVQKYGLKAYTPIAEGFSYSHSNDFGSSRSFGYRRPHLGHDLMGSVGSPVVAVESGIIEALGWNRYGGWRIGIRSLDTRRYYYYAHLRRDKPFQPGLREGDLVQAGDVIGYLGMTGYSDKENVNGMSVPHLHFGLQLIFDESQKEGKGEIWVDAYQIINFLERHRSTVVRESATGYYHRKYSYIDFAAQA